MRFSNSFFKVFSRNSSCDSIRNSCRGLSGYSLYNSSRYLSKNYISTLNSSGISPVFFERSFLEIYQEIPLMIYLGIIRANFTSFRVCQRFFKDFTTDCSRDNPKIPQVFHHRIYERDHLKSSQNILPRIVFCILSEFLEGFLLEFH